MEEDYCCHDDLCTTVYMYYRNKAVLLEIENAKSVALLFERNKNHA